MAPCLWTSDATAGVTAASKHSEADGDADVYCLEQLEMLDTFILSDRSGMHPFVERRYVSWMREKVMIVAAARLESCLLAANAPSSTMQEGSNMQQYTVTCN